MQNHITTVFDCFVYINCMALGGSRAKPWPGVQGAGGTG